MGGPDGKTVLLGDFGLATVCAGGAAHVTVAGSPFYMAPEMVAEDGYDAAVDVWAVGCCVLSLCLPPDVRRRVGLKSVVALQPQDVREKAFEALAAAGYSAALVAFARGCLTADATKRPTAGELCRHEFVLSHDDVTTIEL
jgi:serine/threonine protein kinase